MSSGIVLRTGIALTLVAVSTLSGCGDDDAPAVTESDAGDAAVDATDSTETDETTSNETEVTNASDESTSTSSEPESDATAATSDTGSVDASAADASGESTDVDASDVGADASTSSNDGTGSSSTQTQSTQSSEVGSDAGDTSSDLTDVSTELDASVDASDESDESGEDASTATSEADSGVDEGDAATDAEVSPPVGWVGLEVGEAEVHAVDVAADGDEGYYGLVFDAAGNFYTVGSATDTSGAAPDQYLTVTKFLANGEVDETFGSDGDGVARINVAEGGTESARAIVIQNVEPSADAGADAAADAGVDARASTSYIVIAGTAQFNPDAAGLEKAELDAVLVRFDMSGALDADFGTAGVATIDFNTGNEGVNNQGAAAWVNNDAVWSLSTTMGDRLVIHGSQRGEGTDALDDGGTAPRADADWLLLRLKADGTPDDSFGDDGKVLLDIGRAGASARAATVLPDGSIIGVGYLNSDVLGVATLQPVLYKVDQNGNFDPTFATEDAWAADGVYHDFAVTPPLGAEAYGAAPQADKFVTLGYGPSNVGGGLTSDMIALRFTGDGQFDTTFGSAGATYLDYAGQGDNGRAVLVLPDNTVLAIGGGRTLLDDQVTTQSDGVLGLLTPDGEAIDAFGTNGMRGYDLEGGLTDFFWAGALSPDQNSVVVVGIKGGVMTDAGTPTDSQSVVLVLPLTEIVN